MKFCKNQIGSVAIALAALATTLVAAEPPVDSKITAVTVYRDRAIVTRSATLSLETGSHRLTFGKVPLDAEEASLRASTTSSAAEILGLSHQIIQGSIDGSEERRLVRSIDSLNNIVLSAFDDRLAVLAKQKEMLEQFVAGGTQALSGDLSKSTFDAQSWESAYLFISKSLSRVIDSIRVVKLNREVPNSHRLELAAQLEKIRSSSKLRHHEVVIDVEMVRSASFEVSLEYMVPRATWSPLYNARLLDGGKVEVSYFGQVAQTTGEDWTDVQLVLSTAQPNRTATPGDLQTRTIGLVEQKVNIVTSERNLISPQSVEPFGQIHFRGGRSSDETYVVDGVQVQDSMGGASAEDAVSYSGLVGVSSDASAYSTQFVVTRKETIKSADKVARIPIAQWTLDGEETLIARTQNQQHAFRSLKLINKTGIPLLPGRFNLFVGGDYVGVLNSPGLILAEQEFEMAFGIEDAIAIKREILNRRQKVNGEKRLLAETISINLTNNSNSERIIKLEEALPVSNDSRIKVEIKSTSPSPVSTDAQKHAQWTIKLAPGEKATVSIDYEVEFPGGMAISGL